MLFVIYLERERKRIWLFDSIQMLYEDLMDFHSLALQVKRESMPVDDASELLRYYEVYETIGSGNVSPQCCDIEREGNVFGHHG